MWLRLFALMCWTKERKIQRRNFIKIIDNQIESGTSSFSNKKKSFSVASGEWILCQIGGILPNVKLLSSSNQIESNPITDSSYFATYTQLNWKITWNPIHSIIFVIEFAVCESEIKFISSIEWALCVCVSRLFASLIREKGTFYLSLILLSHSCVRLLDVRV